MPVNMNVAGTTPLSTTLTQPPMQPQTAGLNQSTLYQLTGSNMGDKNATIHVQGLDHAFVIPSNSTGNINAAAAADPVILTATDPDGKDLLINGAPKFEVKASDPAKNMVIHTPGKDFLQLAPT